MSADDIMNKVVSRINPDYGGIGTKNNCRRCTYAYEMSRRGFNVKATKSVSATGQNIAGAYNMLGSTTKKSGTSMAGIVKTMFDESRSGKENASNSLSKYLEKYKDRTYTGKTSKEIASKLFDALSNQPDRSRGEVAFSWTVGGAHSIAYEIINNKPVLFDCQSGKSFKNIDDVISYYGNFISSAEFNRLDNVSLDFDQLLKWVQNA